MQLISHLKTHTITALLQSRLEMLPMSHSKTPSFCGYETPTFSYGDETPAYSCTITAGNVADVLLKHTHFGGTIISSYFLLFLNALESPHPSATSVFS